MDQYAVLLEQMNRWGFSQEIEASMRALDQEIAEHVDHIATGMKHAPVTCVLLLPLGLTEI